MSPLTTPRSNPLRRVMPLSWPQHLCLLGAALLAAPVLAAPAATSAELQDRYRQERAACSNGSSNQDRATCLREAGAAHAEALKGGLGDGSAPYAANATQRCDRLPEDDRADCAARMKGQGSTSGSVAGGGIYRELTTREVVLPNPPKSAAPASAPLVAPQR